MTMFFLQFFFFLLESCILTVKAKDLHTNQNGKHFFYKKNIRDDGIKLLQSISGCCNDCQAEVKRNAKFRDKEKENKERIDNANNNTREYMFRGGGGGGALFAVVVWWLIQNIDIQPRLLLLFLAVL